MPIEVSTIVPLASQCPLSQILSDGIKFVLDILRFSVIRYKSMDTSFELLSYDSSLFLDVRVVFSVHTFTFNKISKPALVVIVIRGAFT